MGLEGTSFSGAITRLCLTCPMVGFDFDYAKLDKDNLL